MAFPRQEYWNGLPFPSLGELPDLGIKYMSLDLEGGWFILENTGFLAAPKHPHRDANWKFRFESQKPQGQCYVKGETEDSTASM